MLEEHSEAVTHSEKWKTYSEDIVENYEINEIWVKNGVRYSVTSYTSWKVTEKTWSLYESWSGNRVLRILFLGLDLGFVGSQPLENDMKFSMIVSYNNEKSMIIGAVWVDRFVGIENDQF